MGALPTQTNIQPATEATETMRALEWHGKFSLKMATVPKRASLVFPARRRRIAEN